MQAVKAAEVFGGLEQLRQALRHGVERLGRRAVGQRARAVGNRQLRHPVRGIGLVAHGVAVAAQPVLAGRAAAVFVFAARGTV